MNGFILSRRNDTRENHSSPFELHASRGRTGFTLIELLVVIAIIALIASLLLPALSRTKQKAHSLTCKSKLHQMGIAIAMYTHDNDSTFPPFRLDPGTVIPRKPNYWSSSILPYLHLNWTNRQFHCPEYTDLVNDYAQTKDVTNFPFAGSYAFNATGTSVGGNEEICLGLGDVVEVNGTTNSLNRPVKEAAVSVPSEMYAVGDARRISIPGYPKLVGFTYLNTVSEKHWSSSDQSALAPRHGPGFNLLHVDGHVLLIKARDFNSVERSARLFNNDHEPHPKTWQ